MLAGVKNVEIIGIWFNKKCHNTFNIVGNSKGMGMIK